LTRTDRPQAEKERTPWWMFAGPGRISLQPVGHSRAVTALSHSILTAAWHMLGTGEVYNDPSGDYFAGRDPERHTRRLVANSNASDTPSRCTN
jgi:hypothetical protein